jgi:hypothetical protein
MKGWMWVDEGVNVVGRGWMKGWIWVGVGGYIETTEWWACAVYI